ncbi:hypothetical protein Aduo_014804 [Ancylostoma duodenale]
MELELKREDVLDFSHDLSEAGYSNEKYSTVVYDENRRGRAKGLARRAIDMARSEYCDWVATAATALTSQEILIEMKFKTLYEIPYKAFLENGRAVFRNLHDYCQSGRFMALRLKA